MKLTFFIPDLYEGGAESVMLTYMNEFCKLHEVNLVVVRKQGSLYNNLNKKVKVTNLYTNSVYKSFFALYVYLKHTRPHILISALDTANILSTIVAKTLNIKNITTVHGVISEKYMQSHFLRKILMMKLVRIIRKSSVVVAVSRGVKEDLVHNFNINNVEIIYNPVIKSYPVISTKNEFLLAVGRLETVKDFETLIKAFALVHQENVDMKLFILGKGSLEEYLKQLVIEFRLENHVLFEGYKNPDDYYARAKILISSSKTESFGNVLVEAMSYGVNIVATNTLGSAEILEDGKYGTIVPIGDFKAMAKAIIERLDTPIDYKVLQKKSGDFTTASSITALEKLIKQVMKQQ